MEPLSLTEIRELVARGKEYVFRLQHQLAKILAELCDIEIGVTELESMDELKGSRKPVPSRQTGARQSRQPTLDKFTEILNDVKWNIAAASRVIGVHRNTLDKWIKDAEIEIPPRMRRGGKNEDNKPKGRKRRVSRRSEPKTKTISDLAEDVLMNAMVPLKVTDLAESVETLAGRGKSPYLACR